MKLRPKHYWRKHLQERKPYLFTAVVCNASGTISQLSTKPQPALNWFERWIAFLTTLFKSAEISGWKETGCVAEATGHPVRDAQHSTDGFWTIDLALTAFRIGDTTAADGRFIRVEVEPRTKAHDVFSKNKITGETWLAFGGPVVIDSDGPFLEVHPDEDFRIMKQDPNGNVHKSSCVRGMEGQNASPGPSTPGTPPISSPGSEAPRSGSSSRTGRRRSSFRPPLWALSARSTPAIDWSRSRDGAVTRTDIISQ